MGLEVAIGEIIRLDEYPVSFLYLCGVSRAGWDSNCHAAMEPAKEGQVCIKTFNGFKVEIQNVRSLEIPSLPEGFRGLDPSFTTCRNFQFGVAYLTEIPLSSQL